MEAPSRWRVKWVRERHLRSACHSASSKLEGDMTEKKTTILTAREAAKYLRVCLWTLRKMEGGGSLAPRRTPGGHRRYSLRMLNEYLKNSCKPPRRRESESKPPRSKLRGIPSGMIVLGAAAPKPPLVIPPSSKLGGILANLVNLKFSGQRGTKISSNQSPNCPITFRKKGEAWRMEQTS